MSDSVDRFRSNLNELISKQGFNASSLGRAAGVSRQYITQLQMHERVPTIAVLDKIAGAFGLPGWAMIASEDAEKFIELLRKSSDDDALVGLVSTYLEGSSSQREMMLRVAQGILR